MATGMISLDGLRDKGYEPSALGYETTADLQQCPVCGLMFKYVKAHRPGKSKLCLLASGQISYETYNSIKHAASVRRRAVAKLAQSEEFREAQELMLRKVQNELFRRALSRPVSWEAVFFDFMEPQLRITPNQVQFIEPSQGQQVQFNFAPFCECNCGEQVRAKTNGVYARWCAGHHARRFSMSA